MYQFSRVSTGLFLAVLLSSCIAKKVELAFDDYQPVQLDKASIIPRNSDLNSQKKTVVVFAYDETDQIYTKQSNVKKVISSQIENSVTSIGVELVSREGDQQQRLKDEVKLYKTISERGRKYTGPYKSDYVVMGLINAVDVTSDLSKNLLNKDTVVCNYKASIIGSIRIYDTSERRIVEDIGFDGTKRSSETPKTRDCSLGHNTKALIRGASELSIELVQAKVQNFFLSRGTVLEKRVKDKSAIFKVSIGKNNKLQPGDDVEVYTLYRTKNPLTDQTSLEERKIATGVVTDFVGSNFAWVSVADVEQAKRVQLGNPAKVIYKDSIAKRVLGVAGISLNKFK